MKQFVAGRMTNERISKGKGSRTTSVWVWEVKRLGEERALASKYMGRIEREHYLFFEKLV